MDEAPDHYLVEMQGIVKDFPGTKALDDVHFSLRQGEVHALIGENGAGKSTLIKILAGIFRADRGEIRIDGRPVAVTNPKIARQSGISVVFQEFNLIPELTVVENLFLSVEKTRGGVFLQRKQMYLRSQGVLEKVGLDIDPTRKVADYSVAEQQLIEIAKALLINARILVLDEPTAVLAKQEVENIFQIIRQLKNEGRAIAFVSHRLDEVLKIADCITVLKDGRNVDTLTNENVSRDRLIRLMVGKSFKDLFIQKERPPARGVILEVEGMTVENKLHDISFEVRGGEIVALGGLEGHGQRTILEALFGLHRYRGNVSLLGRSLKIRKPKEALQHGIMMITDDRKGEGLCLDQSVLYNLELLGYDRFCSKIGIIRPSLEKKLAAEVIAKLGIKTPSMRQPVKLLSGGNQQKILVGRISYLPRIRLLLFKELTRGVDVGAKIEIYNLLHELVKEMARTAEMGILFYSSDLLEILGLSDRIIGIYDGRVTAIMENKELDEEKLMSSIISGAGKDDHSRAASAPVVSTH